MLSCTCSVRAIESFVRDVVGVRVRQLRPHVQFHLQRSFSTRSPYRQVQPSTTTLTPADDALLPFDPAATKTKDPTVTRGKKRPVTRAPRDLDPEWHAEIEITSPLPEDKTALHSAHDAAVEGSRGESREVGVNKVDSDQFESNLNSGDANVTKIAQDPSVASKTPQVPIENSVQKRLERKRRRKEAGSFAKNKGSSHEPSQEEISEEHTQTVSEQFDALEGSPSSAEQFTEQTEQKPKEATTKVQKKSKKKKTRRDTPEYAARKEEERAAWKALMSETFVAQERIAQKGARAGKKSLERWQIKTNKRHMKKQTLEEIRAIAPQRHESNTVEEAPIKSMTAEALKVKPKKETWQVQKAALNRKFGEQGWQPRKRLSPDTIEGIRAMHVSDPAAYTTQTLSEHFQVTPEAIRRILKSKWRPNTEEAEDRRQRWEKRGVKKWTEMAQQGVRPPAKWRAMGIKIQEPGESTERTRRRSKGDGVRWADDSDPEGDNMFARRIL